MFGSSALEVAIGLALLYTLLAAIGSHMNELLAGLLGWRASFLRRGVADMLGDPQLADQVLAHPLLASIGRSSRRGASYIPSDLFAAALVDTIWNGGHTRARPASASRHPALASLASSTDGTPEALGRAVEGWFNAAMDRVSGAYKRRVQVVLLGLSGLLTFGIGADSLTVAQSLYHDQTLRAGAAAVASTAKANVDLQQAISLLQSLTFPLGWAHLPGDAQGWAFKVAGLLITMAAVSVGAPFWFGLLSALVNLRSSGPKPQNRPLVDRNASPDQG